MVKMTRSKTFQAYLPSCHRTYSCIHCRAHLANHDELISKSFQGSQGRAYLFNSVVNVGCGPAEERVLLTGLHAVADIYCENCKTTLGWKYEHAFESSQKYKEGKYIIELAHMIKDNGWDWRDSQKPKKNIQPNVLSLEWASNWVLGFIWFRGCAAWSILSPLIHHSWWMASKLLTLCLFALYSFCELPSASCSFVELAKEKHQEPHSPASSLTVRVDLKLCITRCKRSGIRGSSCRTEGRFCNYMVGGTYDDDDDVLKFKLWNMFLTRGKYLTVTFG